MYGLPCLLVLDRSTAPVPASTWLGGDYGKLSSGALLLRSLSEIYTEIYRSNNASYCFLSDTTSNESTPPFSRRWMSASPMAVAGVSTPPRDPSSGSLSESKAKVKAQQEIIFEVAK